MSSIEFSQGLHHEVKVWDRFIRNREQIQHRFIGSPKDYEACEDTIINQEPYRKSKELYKQRLASALSLNFRPIDWVPHWPVRPRSKPCLRSPNIILDLPNIRHNVHMCDIVDWSATSYLTVAFPRSVYLWHSLSSRTLKIQDKDICCLKWNEDGSALFMASRNGSFKYSDMNVNEDLTTTRHTPCHIACFIRCCAFHPKSPILYLGCSMGSVTAFYINKGIHIMLTVDTLRQDESILNLRPSTDGTYLAVSSLLPKILIYETTKYTCVVAIQMTGPSRAVAWHPWKKNLVVVTDCMGYMALYNVMNPLKPLATYLSTEESNILNVSFNPISAELVVSQIIYFTDGEGTGDLRNRVRSISSQVSVLSSFDRVVDRMEGHQGPVQFFNWSPDGTQLATSGSDETARIWDFLPQTLKQGNNKKYSKMNNVSASLEIGKRMGLSIR